MNTTAIIAYAGQPIANTAQLSHGARCRYLECIVGHNGNLIAKSWRRSPVGEVCIDFKYEPTEDCPIHLRGAVIDMLTVG